jgi:membrane-associated protease RseP (regulator of RpoE activity)
MTSTDNQTVERLSRLFADMFDIAATYDQSNRIVFALSYRFSRAKSKQLLSERLKTAGYDFEMSESEDQLLVTIDPKQRIRIPILNILLFFLTLATVYIVPVYFRHGSYEATIRALAAGKGLVFTFAMISILFVHEMGHFIAGRRRGIITSWPYFIPAPNIIGTFGAVIKSKSPFWNRRDLIEVGAWGPIAGWVVAIGWLIYGLSTSAVYSAETFPIGEMAFQMNGESILMRFLTLNILGPIPPDHYYYLSEAAFAGWVGMLVTAINMLPIGQLDGGHIIYGLMRRQQRPLAHMAVAGLDVLGFFSPMWWIFAFVGIVFGMAHPPTLDDSKRLNGVAIALGVLSLIILILSFTPVPFQ